jgi:hypothetical protein
MKPLCRLLLSLVLLSSDATGSMAGDDASVIPLTLAKSDFGGGRIYVPVRFGNVQGQMRLDTGASTTRITLAPWNKDLPISAQSASTGASGKATRCEDVEAKNVQLVAARGNNIARAKYEVSRCETGDGDLLGLDFFKGVRFTLDFARHEMTVSREALAAGRGKPFRLLGPDARLVGVEVRAGRTSALGLFDTGAEISAVDQRFVDAHKKLFTLVKKSAKGGEAGGRRFTSKIYKIKVLDLGEGRILRNVHALAYDFGALREALKRETPFILGYNVVSAFDWVLDFTSPQSPRWEARAR